ncbi:MAG: transcriptional regulator [Crocinitomicaceae bacterium]|nr:transcriptional regulator [Crocinitomicaceae bacterium]
MKVRMFDLRVKDKFLHKNLLSNFKKILKHGVFFFGPELHEFEKKMSKYLGVKYALGVASGSSALYIALKSLGIRKGDEVITTPFSWIITSNAIVECGATPVFCDIKDDYNINPDLIESKITKKTKAILPMHWGGHICDMKSILKIAKKYNLFVVEDSAQSFGAEFDGKKTGSFSDVAAFSMNPMKPLNGFGEGGLIVTNKKKLYEKAKILRYAGTTSDPKKIITNNCLEVSLNHKMDTVNASMLLASLKNFKKKRKKLSLIKRYYEKNLSKKILLQKFHKKEKPGLYAFPIQVKSRDRIKKFLESKNIETKIWNSPLICDSPAYKKYKKDKLPIARKVLSKTLNIPFHENMTNDQIKFVVDQLNLSIKKFN